MLMTELQRYGIPARIVERWRRSQGDILLTVQSKAVKRGLLGNSSSDGVGPNMVVSAPTSSGKSFCAEMAAIQALGQRRKVVFLSPLKALVEQLHDRLATEYSDMGLKIIVLTSDHPDGDVRFRRGDYDLALAVYEKFDLLLTTNLDRLAAIGLIVVDEIQCLADPGRGAVLERLLTRIRASVYTPRILALSAVLGDSGDSAGCLAKWLDAILVDEATRPVDLEYGIVAADGVCRWRSYNTGQERTERREPLPHGRFERFAELMKADRASTLVFLKSRRETVDSALKLASTVGWPEAATAMKALAGEDESYLVQALYRALTRRVAFHNADLTYRQRAIVERAFLDKEVRVLFATTTLAMGMNLAADTVFLETARYQTGAYVAQPQLMPVSRVQFENMCGRAGRLKPGDTTRHPGRAIVLADSEFESDVLWEHYIAARRCEPLASAWPSMPPVDWSLSMLVSGLADSVAGLRSVYDQTLCATLNPSPAAVADFQAVVERLQRLGCVTVDSVSEAVRTTALGQAVGGSGMLVSEAEYFARQLARHWPQSETGWLLLLLSGPDWQPPPGFLSRIEYSEQLPVRRLYAAFNCLPADIRSVLPPVNERERIPIGTVAALKALLLLEDWCRLVPIDRLERRYQVHLGQIQSLAGSVAHLAAGLAGYLQASNCDTDTPRRLRSLSFSLRHGLPEDMRELHRLVGDYLSRNDFVALRALEVKTPEELQRLTPEDLVRGGLSDCNVKKMNEKTALSKLEDYMETQVSNKQWQPNHSIGRAGRLESVEVDGRLDRERYLIRINGHPVRLTGKSFKYFTKLAWSRQSRESGWIFKEEIEAGYNQARYLYRMKQEIANGYPGAGSIVENNRLGYYRLNVEPSAISIDYDNLMGHDDYELRDLARSSMAEQAN